MAAHNAEWRAWLALLELLQDELASVRWHAAAQRLSSSRISSSSESAQGPLLEAAVIPVSRPVADAWLSRLLGTAARHANAHDALLRARTAAALELLAAAVAHDYRRPPQLAAVTDDQIPALAATLSLAVMPLLHACADALTDQLPAKWAHGYCPVCGAWPALAEVRGLERTRVMRCVRCGTGWQTTVLVCPFCGERDHNRLRSLIPETENAVRHLEVCTTCNGYVKVMTVLQGVPAAELAVEDLATVELDLVALQRGFARPPDSGHPIQVHLIDDERSLRAVMGISS